MHKEIAAGVFPNIPKLAELFEVTERTIKRDLAALRDEFNAPLKFDRRKNGFYYSVAGWSPPLHRLSEGDLLSFFIAENALKLTGQNSQALQLKTSLAKIASMLPDEISVDLATLGENVSFQNTPFLTIDPKMLQFVAGTSMAQQTIEFDYYSPHNQQRTHRKADVYVLHNFAGDWYAISFDHEKQDYRDFHIGRMSSIGVTGECFERRNDWHAEDYLARGFSMMRRALQP